MTGQDAMSKSGAIERASERMYRGLWGVLARWMRVPKDPPTLPAGMGDDVIAIHPSPGFLRYLKFWFWIVLAITDIALIVGWTILFVVLPWAGILTAPLWLALIVLPDIVAFIAIHLRYDTTWYVLSGRSMRLRRGIWTIREITLTYENIQNVRVTQGPVERHFGIAKLEVETAGASAPVPGHSGVGNVGTIEGIDHAEQLRDMIMDRVRASRSTGLGDERTDTAAHRAISLWTPAHVEALREIRDLAQAM